MEKIFKNTAYTIFELFLKSPTKEFSARGIARELQISHATALPILKELKKHNLIKSKDNLYKVYYANRESEKYKWYKKTRTIFKLYASGFVNDIQKKIIPSTIILFGSAARGTDTEKSDIDIFVEAKEKKIDINQYEKKVKKQINILFEQKIENLSEELRSNIMNGFILYGFLRYKHHGTQLERMSRKGNNHQR